MKLKINGWKHHILSFIYITVTVIFQFTVLQIGDSYLYQYQNYVTEGNRQDFKVVDISLDESNSLKRNFVQQFSDYKPMYLQTTCFVSNMEGKGATQINLCAGNKNGLNEIKDVKAEVGRFPKTSNEIMIERTWNNHLAKQFKVNDTLRVEYLVENQKKIKSFTISGIYESKISESTPIFWGNEELFHGFDKIALANDFYFLSMATTKMSSVDTYYDLTLDTYENSMHYPKGNHTEFTDKEQEKIRLNNKKFIENESKLELYYNNESIVHSGNVMRYLGFFILLPLILTLVALQYLQTKLHMQEYRTLRCLGYNKRQLYLQLWKESLWSAIPAVIVGILIGTILNIFIGTFVLDNLVISGSSLKIIYTWRTYILAIVLGIVPLILSTTISMVRLKQKYPLQDIIKRQKKQMKSYRDVLHFSPLSTIFILCIFSVMLFFYMISVNLLLILPKEVVSLKEQLSSYEIMPNTVGVSINDNIVNGINKIENVKKSYLADNGSMQMLSYKNIFIPHYVYNDDLMKVFLKKNHLPSNIQNGVVYVFPQAFDKTNTAPLENGESYVFQIQTLENQITMKNIKVDRVVAADLVNLDGVGRVNQNRPILLFSEKAAKEIFGNVRYTNVFLQLSNTMSEEQVRTISTLLGNEDFSHSEYKDEFYTGQMKVVTILIGYFTFIVCFTAMLCFYCVLSCILMTKKKEIGVLRAVGLSRKCFFVSMLLEVMYMLILSVLLAFIVFFILFSFITNTAQTNSIAVLEPSFYNYVWTLLIGVFACMVVITFMINYQSKQQIIVEIKESGGK